MKKKQLFVTFLLTSFPLALVSCTIEVTTTQRAEEDRKLSSTDAKNFVENEYVKNILAENFFKSSSLNLDAEFANTNSAFFAQAKRAFDFYQNYQVGLEPTYSLKLIADLQNKNALSTSEFATLSAQAGYKKIFNSEAFIILYKNFATGIAQTINKMLLVRSYLTQLTDKSLLENSQIYKDGISDKSPSSIRELFQSIDPNSPDFFLIYLMLNKSPAQIWQFESNDQNSISTFSQLSVKDVNSFNNFLRSEKIDSKSTRKEQEFEKLGTNDSLDSSLLLGYSGILYRQNVNQGDLSFQIKDLKTQGQVKSGFFDSQTNLIWSSDQIKNFVLFAKAKIFPVVFKDGFDKKNTNNKVEISDLEIKTSGNLSGIEYKIQRIFPDLNSDKLITAIVEIKIGSAKYFYSAQISWDEKKFYFNPEINTNGNNLPTIGDGIPSTLPDLSKISVKYVNKLAPLYDKVVTDSSGKKVYFSLDNTPWKTDVQKTILAYSLYLADQTGIFQDAKNFFESTGYKTEIIDKIIKEK
ncbi:hypothetical protein IM807_01105 [Mycoplasma sp. 'Moose RK']|nr:hypothetical protein [Mycoplasma sp. 'Moose RK']